MTRLRLSQCLEFHSEILQAAVDYNIAYSETEVYRLAFLAFRDALNENYGLDLSAVQEVSKDLEKIFRIFLRQIKGAALSVNEKKSQAASQLLDILDYKTFFSTTNRDKRNACLNNFFDKSANYSSDVFENAGVVDEYNALKQTYDNFYNEYKVTTNEFKAKCKSKNQELKREVNKKFLAFVEFINALINVSHDENLYLDFCNKVNNCISETINIIRQSKRTYRKHNNV